MPWACGHVAKLTSGMCISLFLFIRMLTGTSNIFSVDADEYCSHEEYSMAYSQCLRLESSIKRDGIFLDNHYFSDLDEIRCVLIRFLFFL